jgi:ribosome biogenesis GTPase yqeH
MISVETGLKLVPAGEISRKTFKLGDGQIFMFDAFCRFKVKENEIEDETEGKNIYKPMFSAYSSKNVKFHIAKEERVEDLLQGDFFEILKGEEKKKYFENKFVTFETTVEENEDLVISGLGWINVKRGPLTIELTVPEGVKVIVRPSIFKGKK